MADHTEKIRNIILEESGIFRTSSAFSKYPINYDRENISLKVYPPFYMTAPGLAVILNSNQGVADLSFLETG